MSLTDTNAFVTDSAISGNSGSGNAYGIDFIAATTGRDLEVDHSQITKADGGPGAALHTQIATGTSSVAMRNSRIATRAGSGDLWAISNERTGGTGTMTIDGSQIESTGDILENQAMWTTKIGASLLSGDAITDAGTLICVHTYDEDYVALVC
jgi:hypothetical protein